MRASLALFLVVVASASAQVVRNVCRPTEIVFLLDHSENARKASKLENGPEFQLLSNAWENFMRDLAASGDNLFSIWAWSYTGRTPPEQLVQRDSRPSQCLNQRFGNNNGGSWTYKGIEQLVNLTARPRRANNVVIIISAQGSLNNGRRQLAEDRYRSLRNLGWNTYVIGVKSSQEIDVDELTRVSSLRNPDILDDGRATNKKSYSLLGAALTRIKNTVLCPQVVITQPPTLPPPTLPPTRRPPPPRTGICSNCRVDGGYGFDRHPTVCDSFYQCMPDGSYVLKHCASSLVWDDEVGTCVTSSKFNCPTGQCNRALQGTMYRSGLCCNMYFQCNGATLDHIRCPSGQIFDENSRQCVFTNNPIAACQARQGYYCNDKIINITQTCNDYKPDPLGNPCRYMHQDRSMNVAEGTVWDQSTCSLIASEECSQDFSTRGLGVITDNCNAILFSTFDDGRPDIESERQPKHHFGLRKLGVIQTRGSLVFRPNAGNIHAYYWFFNNLEIRPGSAFKITFQLSNAAQNGVEYDLFSNNYCPDCPETIAASVRKDGGSRYTISTRFIEMATNSMVVTSTPVDAQPGGFIELTVVWGATDVHGVVKVLSANKQQVNQVQLQSIRHSDDASILPNKCGIAIGDGANSNFVGLVDYFAYYANCARIDDILSA